MPRPHRSGMIRTSVALRPDQYEKIRALAFASSNELGGAPDSGKIIRAIIDVYLASRPKKKTS